MKQGNGIKKSYPCTATKFKATEKGDDLEKKAGEVIGQIESRDYCAKFRAHGFETVYAYGIAFCGKQIAVRLRNLCT